MACQVRHTALPLYVVLARRTHALLVLCKCGLRGGAGGRGRGGGTLTVQGPAPSQCGMPNVMITLHTILYLLCCWHAHAGDGDYAPMLRKAAQEFNVQVLHLANLHDNSMSAE